MDVVATVASVGHTCSKPLLLEPLQQLGSRLWWKGFTQKRKRRTPRQHRVGNFVFDEGTSVRITA